MLKKIWLKPLLSISLAALIITAPLSAVLHTAAAETENCTVTSGFSDPEYNTSDNLLHGNTSPIAVQWNDGSSASDIGVGFYTRWTDGSFEKGSATDKKGQIDLGNHNSLRIAYDLQNVIDISRVIFVGTDNGYHEDWATEDGCWNDTVRVYVGNDASNLFTDAQKVTDIKNSSWERVFDITYKDGKHPEGQYIGFEVVKYGNYPIFIEELIVSGSATGAPVEPYNLSLGFSNPEYNTSDNLIHGNASPIVQWNDSSADVPNEDVCRRWTDGAFEKGTADDKKGQIDMGSHTSLKIAYDLESAADIARIIFAGTDNGYADGEGNVLDGAAMDGCWNGKLGLYVSDNKDNLFTFENQVLFEDLNWSRVADVAFNAGKHPQGRYIGFEVFKAGGYPIFIEELIVSGSTTGEPQPPGPEIPDDPSKPYTVLSKKVDTNEGMESLVNDSYADNILAGKRAIAVKASDNTAWINSHNSTEWTNGRYDFPINTGTDGLNSPLRFLFDAKEEYEISKLQLFAHPWTFGPNHRKYTISFANSKNDLFTENANGTIVINNSGDKNVFTVEYKEGFEKPKGRWIGLEIHGASDGGGNIQMREFAVYGTKTGAPIVDDPSDNIEIYENYTVQIKGITTDDVSARADSNLLLGIEPTLTNDQGFEGRYLQGNHWNFVDGAIYQEGHADYASPNGDNEPMRFTYDLLQTVPVDQFLIVHYYYRNGSYNFTSNEYELYVGNDLQTLYDAENRVFNYVNANNFDPTVPYSGTQQLFTFTGEKPVGRYIGVRMVNLSAADNTGRIDQLAIYSEGKLPVDAAIAQTFTDAQTGIKVSVLRKRSNDLFDIAKALKITKEPLSFEAKTFADDLHLNLIDSAYRIELLKADGSVLTDSELDGRVVKIEIPSPADGRLNNKRLCEIKNGRLDQLPYTFNGEEYITAFRRGALGTFAVFEDTLIGLAEKGAADVDLENGMDGINTQTGDSTPIMGVAVLACVSALAVLGISKKRWGGKNK